MKLQLFEINSENMKNIFKTLKKILFQRICFVVKTFKIQFSAFLSIHCALQSVETIK